LARFCIKHHIQIADCAFDQFGLDGIPAIKFDGRAVKRVDCFIRTDQPDAVSLNYGQNARQSGKFGKRPVTCNVRNTQPPDYFGAGTQSRNFAGDAAAISPRHGFKLAELYNAHDELPDRLELYKETVICAVIINEKQIEFVSEKISFRDIKVEVFRRIRAGEYGPGDLIPGEVELAAEFGCARATVNRAMQELSDDGIIDRRRKGGSRVKLAPDRQVKFDIPIIRTEIEAKGFEYSYELISSRVEKAPDWLKTRLKIEDSPLVRHVQCLHRANGAPFQFEDRWINLKAVPRAELADFSIRGPNEWLVSEVPYTNAEIRFSATAAEAFVATHLNTSTGHPIFLSERTTWLVGVPVTNVRLYFASAYEMVAKY
jgi:GntR family transcriptional regulator, histidine utilization repressor